MVKLGSEAIEGDARMRMYMYLPSLTAQARICSIAAERELIGERKGSNSKGTDDVWCKFAERPSSNLLW